MSRSTTSQESTLKCYSIRRDKEQKQKERKKKKTLVLMGLGKSKQHFSLSLCDLRFLS